MKKKLTAVVIVLAVCLALLLVFAIYITVAEHATQPTEPDTKEPVGEISPSVTTFPTEETPTAKPMDVPGLDENQNPSEETKPSVQDETELPTTVPTEAVTQPTTVPTEPVTQPTRNPAENETTEPVVPEVTTTPTMGPIEPDVTDPVGETGGAAEGLQGENELPMEPFE